MPRLVLVGAGRLGRSLAALLGPEHARLVHHTDPVPEAEIVWLTVPDRALAAVAAQVPPGPLLLHAAGAAGLDVLAPHTRRGSLHPLMTFPGPEVVLPDLHGVYAAIDAAHPDDHALVDALARRLGLVPVHVPGPRALYHAAAVIAGNHATVLISEAGRALAAAGLEPELARRMLAPLLHASVEGALHDPQRALTGPAARGDTATLAAHREALVAAGLVALLPAYDALNAAAAHLAGRHPGKAPD